MDKKIVYNEKAKELKEKIAKLRKEQKAEEARNWEIYRRYCDMEGMYGKLAVSPWDCGNGLRGYHYEYSSSKIEQKEKEERENFLKENNWLSSVEVMKKYYDMISPLENELNLELYGMTTEEKSIADRIKRKEKELEEYKEEIKKAEEQVKEWKKELEELKKVRES